MPIQSASILIGPAISVSGGTAQTFSPDGNVISRGIQISDSSEADIRTRDLMIFKNTNGQLQSGNTWSKDKRSVKIVSPDLLPDGITQDFPFLEITLVKSPLHTAAKLTALKEKGIQVLNDADFAAFWTSGSMA